VFYADQQHLCRWKSSFTVDWNTASILVMLPRQSPTRLCASHQFNLSYPLPSLFYRVLAHTPASSLPSFKQYGASSLLAHILSNLTYGLCALRRPPVSPPSLSVDSTADRFNKNISGDDPFHLSIRVCIPSHESNFTQYVRSLRAHFARSTPFVTISTRIQPRIATPACAVHGPGFLAK
jgi:hypothetical protein